MRFEPSRLLVGAAWVTWGIVAAAEVARLVEWPPGAAAIVEVCGALAVFAGVFVAGTASARLGTRGRAAAIAIQSVAALAVIARGHGGFAAALLVIVAGQAPLIVSARAAIACVAAQTAVLAAIMIDRWGVGAGLLSSAIYVGFQLFALAAAHLAQRESAARRELARAHAELIATQALFADSTRVAERLRISRELHDALGHHLAALSLQLEVARNVADGRAVEPVAAAHAIAKQLLGELREVVGAMRADAPLELARALRLLIAGVPRPEVELALTAPDPADAAVAHVLFRCVQEALTNAIRHARADHIWIELGDDGDGGLVLTARDDGRGAATITHGHGLTGLAERVAAIGGRLELETAPGRGLTLRARVPRRSAP